MKSQSPWTAFSRQARSFGRNLRLAVFGRRRPSRAVRDALMASAAEIDPAHADPRAIVPEEPPSTVVEDRTEGSPHAHEGPRPSTERRDETRE